MRSYSMLGGLLSGLLLLPATCTTTAVKGDDVATSDREQVLVDRWMAVYQEIHKTFSVTCLDGDQLAPIEAEPVSIMTLATPKKSRHGRVFLWIVSGRPVAIQCLQSVFATEDSTIRNVSYEFHSLSQQPVQAVRDGNLEWDCSKPGVDWINVDGVAAPAGTRAARLTQMRSIARECDAGNRNHRLMTQPIFRYPETTAQETDGAIFAIGDWTDPQIFILIEASKDRWRMAFARSQVLPRKVVRNGLCVWSCERGQPLVRTEPWFLYFAAERRLAAEPDVILQLSSKPNTPD